MSSVSVHPAESTALQLDAAILLYRGGNGQSNEVYASAHRVDQQGQIGAGRPLEQSALDDFVKALGEKRRFTGFLPGHVLYAEPGAIVWWMPPTRRRVWFRCVANEPAAAGQNAEAAAEANPDNKAAAKLGSRSGTTPHPGLVFAVNNAGWHVQALNHDRRPLPDDPLFVAPYFNVWSGGQICVGNVRVPQRRTAALTGEFEDLFFRSHFTHPNMPRLVRKGSAFTLWSELLDGLHKTFPVGQLLPASQTLDQWVKQIMKGKP